MNKSESTKNLFTALNKAQGEMKPVAFDAQNAFLKNKYATLGALIESSRPIMLKHGLSIVQMPINEGELVGVETLLAHESGEWISNRFVMHMGDEKGKSLAQVAGSIITYQRRYALGAFLNSYADEDTDGNKSQPEAKPIAPQTTPKPAPKPAAPAAPAKSHAERLNGMIAKILELGVLPKEINAFAFAQGYIKADGNAETDWPESAMPKSKAEFDKLCQRIVDFAQGDITP